MKRHRKYIHSERTFICKFPNCRQSYYSKIRLEIHHRTHVRINFKIKTKDYPFTCNLCNKKFNEKGSYVIHYRTHSGFRPFNCAECNKSFKTKGQLNDHMHSHKKHKPFKCPDCIKSFSRNYYLKSHYKIKHLNIRSHFCKFCKKEFSFKCNLEQHYKRKVRLFLIFSI